MGRLRCLMSVSFGRIENWSLTVLITCQKTITSNATKFKYTEQYFNQRFGCPYPIFLTLIIFSFLNTGSDMCRFMSQTASECVIKGSSRKKVEYQKYIEVATDTTKCLRPYRNKKFMLGEVLMKDTKNRFGQSDEVPASSQLPSA